MCPAGVYEVPEDAPDDGDAHRPDRQPVELRAVRRDHRQGRAPHAARGRRRAGLSGHVAQLRRASAVVRGASRCDASCCPLAAPARPGPPPPQRRRSRSSTACPRSIRSAGAPTFEARVKAARGSDRMQVRFTLQVRDEGLTARWRSVVAPGFDEWLTSAAGVRRYPYARTIQNLSAPASYRTVVRFRWLDADGDVLAQHARDVARLPPARHAPGPRAAADRGRARPRRRTRRYRVALRNDGRTRRRRVRRRRSGDAVPSACRPASPPASSRSSRSPARPAPPGAHADGHRRPRRRGRRARRGRQRPRRGLPACSCSRRPGPARCCG